MRRTMQCARDDRIVGEMTDEILNYNPSLSLNAQTHAKLQFTHESREVLVLGQMSTIYLHHSV